jgi:hypothetical protein
VRRKTRLVGVLVIDAVIFTGKNIPFLLQNKQNASPLIKLSSLCCLGKTYPFIVTII